MDSSPGLGRRKTVDPIPGERGWVSAPAGGMGRAAQALALGLLPRQGQGVPMFSLWALSSTAHSPTGVPPACPLRHLTHKHHEATVETVCQAVPGAVQRWSSPARTAASNSPKGVSSPKGAGAMGALAMHSHGSHPKVSGPS